jgi:hypothetical protein
MPVIPERAPISDVVQGVILRRQRSHSEGDGGADLAVMAHALLLSDPDTAIPLPADVVDVMRGTWIIRYGVRLLEKPRLSIIPGLLALDYGDMLTGEDAWDFLLKKSNLYPRADVVGYRNDGVDDMLPVKRLDLALPLEVLVYPNAQATTPVASLSALILPSGMAETERAAVPARLTEYLPTFGDVEGWQPYLSE